MFDLFYQFFKKMTQNGAKMEAKASQNGAKVAHGAHPNAPPRPRDVQERPQAAPGSILDHFGLHFWWIFDGFYIVLASIFDGFLMHFWISNHVPNE